LDLTTLRQGFTGLELVGTPAEIGLEGPEWTAPVRAELQVDRSGDQLAVRGELSTAIGLECSRCLTAFASSLSGELEAFADRAGKRHQEEGELERADEMRFHDGRQLDLRDDIRESLLLELPMAPLCRPDCRGLCPVCGANWNDGSCVHAAR
jgi:uncharacterized protein